jgi:adenylate cyclase
MREPPPGSFRLGEWSVHHAEGNLCSGSKIVRLEPRVMDVLVYLAARPETVVSKEELLQAVWGGAFVEEGALSQAIHSLRKALGDDARQSRYIQTIPKRGYRLVAGVGREDGASDIVAEAPLRLPAPDATVAFLRSGRLVVLIGAVLTLAAALWFVGKHLGVAHPRPGIETLQPPQAGVRIVVLPFENLGKPENSFFAEGLTEEITKDLASLPSLRVISRTSAMHYLGLRKPLPEIGRELAVSYVLEGTVRWAEGPGSRVRVRITPQLIRVADDAHVWAESYEREMNDIFEVQAEISQRVIGQLGITLMPDQKRALREPPTRSLQAYQAYLRGLELKNQPFYSEKHVQLAVQMFERAIDLDPGFAAAWAELSQAHSYLAFNSDRSPARVEKARQALERAVILGPDLLPVRLAQAYYTYRCLQDFDSTLGQLESTRRRFPNNAEVLQTIGFVLRRQGRLAEAIETLRRAFSLDPRTVKLVWAIAETHRALRDYEQADRYYTEAIALAPDQPFFWEEKAMNRLAWRGKLEVARAVVADAPIPGDAGMIPVAFQLDLYERAYERAIERLASEHARDLPPPEQIRLATLAAIARERLGDRQKTLVAAEANRADLEARIARFPEEPLYRAYLAIALAQLGRPAEALAQAQQAVREKRHDAFTGPRLLELEAVVNGMLGHRHEAIVSLTHLLGTSYKNSICISELRLDPIWDPLRGSPEFEDLLRRTTD